MSTELLSGWQYQRVLTVIVIVFLLLTLIKLTLFLQFHKNLMSSVQITSAKTISEFFRNLDRRFYHIIGLHFLQKKFTIIQIPHTSIVSDFTFYFPCVILIWSFKMGVIFKCSKSLIFQFPIFYYKKYEKKI